MLAPGSDVVPPLDRLLICGSAFQVPSGTPLVTAAKTAATGVNESVPEESLLALFVYPLFWQRVATTITPAMTLLSTAPSIARAPLRVLSPPSNAKLSDSLFRGDRGANNPVSPGA
jgi:hypothetical protein